MGDPLYDPVTKELCEFIYANFPLARSGGVGPTNRLLEDGIVDSMGILLIVDFLELRFGIAVKDTEMVVANFGTIAAIAEFTRRSGGSPAGRRATATDVTMTV